MPLSKLEKASITALKDFMGLTPEETLLIISDEKMRDIATTLFEQGKNLCSEALYVEMKSRNINGQEPPQAIARLMTEVDVVVCPTSKSLTHTKATREAAEKGIRVGTMPNITEDTMVRCFSADYKRIIDTTEKLAAVLRNGNKIRIQTKAGTDLNMQIRKRKVIASTGVLRNIGEHGNLPSGEVYLAPWEGKTNGTLIVDGSMAGIGVIEEPINIQIIDGYAEKINGGKEATRLIEMLEKVGHEARAVGEFGIGTNYKAKLSGSILEDEKVLGTIHIALGNSIGFGGKINVPSHLDGIVTKPTVFMDDIKIMDQGKLIV